MVGTVVDYSKKGDTPWIKVLSGEKLFTFYPKEFDNNIRMGIDVEFTLGENEYTIMNN
jgi:hypothetical protein